MQKPRRRFLQSVVKRAKQKKPIVFLNNETSEASCSRLFFAYVFTRKWSVNQREKIQGCDFLLNRRPHAKIQFVWTKKKKQTKIRHRMVMLEDLQLLIQNGYTEPFRTRKLYNRNVTVQWLISKKQLLSKTVLFSLCIIFSHKCFLLMTLLNCVIKINTPFNIIFQN